MQGVDIFDMKPLDASRKGTGPSPTDPLGLDTYVWGLHNALHIWKPLKGHRWANCEYGTGTLDNPIVVRSFGDEQYAGCTGYPADSHGTIWLTVRSSHSYPLLFSYKVRRESF